VDVGIGLGNTLLEMAPGTLVVWARRAEARGFSSLATIGRVAWPGYEEFVALSAAAAVTERIGLLTDIALVPTYDAARLAKLTASLDAISGGRFTLGVGVGARPDDYAVTGVDFGERGRRLDRQLEVLHESWAGRPALGPSTSFGPPPTMGRIPILFGGDPVRAGRRAARWEGGFTIGGAPPEAAAGMVAAFRESYASAGGSGNPRVVCLSYFGLGDEAESLRQLRAYYAFTGDRAEMIAAGAARSADGVRRRVEAYREMGVDELVFSPSIPVADEVDRLAEIVFGT